MRTISLIRKMIARPATVLFLSSALAIPAFAQQTQPANDSQQTTSAVAQSSSSVSSTKVAPKKEGFWGHLNPFARKKWVHRQVDPINDRLTELDQVNANNAKEIKDVDARAQAGISKAQNSADAADKTALAAHTQAESANGLAQGAASHVEQLNSTVEGLDQYREVREVEVRFRYSRPVLSAEARQQLDNLAAGLAGRKGYILDMQAHAPGSGSLGIQRSQRLAEAVKRYLVTEHQIPVYRMHSVALGNAQVASTDEAGTSRRVRTSTVRVRLMENSLAARDAASPHDSASLSGADRP